MPCEPGCSLVSQLPASILTPDEDKAVVLVSQCFGSTSPEFERFVRHLVCTVHGEPWLDAGLATSSVGGKPR